MKAVLRVSLSLLVVFVAMAATGEAAEWYYWNQTTDNWVDDAAYWTCTYPAGSPAAVPGLEDFAVIKTPGVVKIDEDHTFTTDWSGIPEAIYEIRVGDGTGIDTGNEPYSPYEAGAGHILQQGGEVRFDQRLFVGHAGAPGTSTYEMQGGSLVQMGTEGWRKTVIGHGDNCTGEMTVNDATIELHGDLQIGFESATAVGKLTMTGSSALTIDSGQLQIGSVGGTGTLEMSGTSSVDASNVTTLIGLLSSANATLDMSGDSTFTTAGTLVAYDVVASSTIVLDDNAAYIDQGTLHFGYCGTPDQPRTDIDVTVAGNATLQAVTMHMGLYKGADATISVSSASATPTDTAKVNVDGALTVGYVGGVGDLTIGDRGVVTHTSGEPVYVGVGVHDGVVGSGAVTVESGGTFDNTGSTGAVNIGGDGGPGTWTQNGGSMLNAQGVTLGYNEGTGTLNLNGGVFEAAFVRSDDSVAAPVGSTVNFNGGTLKAAASETNFVGDTGATPLLVANVQSGGAVIDTNGFDVTITAALVEDATSTGGGLEKQGLGMLTLAGANDYSGDTIVTAGTLGLTAAMLDDAADLRIAIDAAVALDFAATDTIAELFFGDTSQATGTWGATGNTSADHTSDLLSGTGLLLVTGASVVVPGDTDDDQDVDDADAAKLAQFWGSSVTAGDYHSGDFNGDGQVNMLDASILAANWTGTSESNAVPEPSVLTLLASCLAMVALRRRGR